VPTADDFGELVDFEPLAWVTNVNHNLVAVYDGDISAGFKSGALSAAQNTDSPESSASAKYALIQFWNANPGGVVNLAHRRERIGQVHHRQDDPAPH
jgi:hypothetical protein